MRTETTEEGSQRGGAWCAEWPSTGAGDAGDAVACLAQFCPGGSTKARRAERHASTGRRTGLEECLCGLALEWVRWVFMSLRGCGGRLIVAIRSAGVRAREPSRRRLSVAQTLRARCLIEGEVLIGSIVDSPDSCCWASFIYSWCCNQPCRLLSVISH